MLILFVPCGTRKRRRATFGRCTGQKSCLSFLISHRSFLLSFIPEKSLVLEALLYQKVDQDVLFSSGDIMQTLMGEGNSGSSASNTTIESEEVD